MIKILRKVNIGVMIVLCGAVILGATAIFASDAPAQTYPTKPVRIVVGTTPGGSPDILARMLGVKLAEALGQQLIVDNRAGASSRIAAEIVARAAPDGYTLMMLTSAVTTATAMYKNLKYNLIKDFAPISLVGTTPSVLVVSPALPAASIKELVALAKSRPGALKFGSGGSGSSTHLPGEIFKHMTGIDILHVPYKASPAALTNTMTGEVDMTFQPLTAAQPMIKSGKLRALGVTSPKRTTLSPDLPSISETVPGYEFMLWQSLVAPAKTPPAILAKLNAEINKALKTSEIREQMAAIGNEPQGSSQQELALYISDQLEKLREAVKMSGLILQD